MTFLQYMEYRRKYKYHDLTYIFNVLIKAKPHKALPKGQKVV